MKNSFLLLGAFIIHNIVYSQSILTEKTKYHVQRMASNKGYEALFPMVCGDGITKKNVEIIYGIDNVSQKTADTLYLVSTLLQLNSQAKLKCIDTFSWEPTKITIVNTKTRGIAAIVRGINLNSDKISTSVDFYFIRKENGIFVTLGE
ncbi:MAG: hypothetical protein RL059_72 [Bacteroidota bacterium]|jgi:hypothetical protein